MYTQKMRLLCTLALYAGSAQALQKIKSQLVSHIPAAAHALNNTYADIGTMYITNQFDPIADMSRVLQKMMSNNLPNFSGLNESEKQAKKQEILNDFSKKVEAFKQENLLVKSVQELETLLQNHLDLEESFGYFHENIQFDPTQYKNIRQALLENLVVVRNVLATFGKQIPISAHLQPDFQPEDPQCYDKIITAFYMKQVKWGLLYGISLILPECIRYGLHRYLPVHTTVSHPQISAQHALALLSMPYLLVKIERYIDELLSNKQDQHRTYGYVKTIGKLAAATGLSYCINWYFTGVRPSYTNLAEQAKILLMSQALQYAVNLFSKPRTQTAKTTAV